MASQNNYETRAGLTPSVNRLPYVITTSIAEEYLQKKLNVVVNDSRRSGIYTGDDITLRLVTVEMGSKFVPFTVVLPTDVLVQSQKKRQNNNRNELSVFNPRENDGTANVIKPIMSFFASYMYDKSDGDAFYSPDWRRARGVSTTISAVLKSNRLPKITRFDRGQMEKVTFLIDPVRVFFDMLKIDGLPSDYRIDIVDWQKQKSGEYRYAVERVLNREKKKGKGGNNLADQLSRKMRGLNS